MAAMKKPLILAVDDAPELLVLMAKVLAADYEVETAHLEVIRCLGRAMEAHESAAAGKRYQRMGLYAKLLAQAAGARPAACEMIEKAAPMHDIGKLAVPAEILRRAGALVRPNAEVVSDPHGKAVGKQVSGADDEHGARRQRSLQQSGNPAECR